MQLEERLFYWELISTDLFDATIAFVGVTKGIRHGKERSAVD